MKKSPGILVAARLEIYSRSFFFLKGEGWRISELHPSRLIMKLIQHLGKGF